LARSVSRSKTKWLQCYNRQRYSGKSNWLTDWKFCRGQVRAEFFLTFKFGIFLNNKICVHFDQMLMIRALRALQCIAQFESWQVRGCAVFTRLANILEAQLTECSFYEPIQTVHKSFSNMSSIYLTMNDSFLLVLNSCFLFQNVFFCIAVTNFNSFGQSRCCCFERGACPIPHLLQLTANPLESIKAQFDSNSRSGAEKFLVYSIRSVVMDLRSLGQSHKLHAVE
jgi:hypothetical protein